MRPTVIMKAAMTLDGQLAAADGTSQWISSPEARQDSHRLRSRVDAVMVGAGTLRADNPRLTARLDDDGRSGRRQPTPIIVAGVGEIPSRAQVFERDAIVLAPAPLDVPGRVVRVPDLSITRVDLAAGLDELGNLGIEQIMVEGGGALFRSLLEAGLVDRVMLYYGPLLAGGRGVSLFGGLWNTLEDAVPVRVRSVRRLGGSIRLDLSLAARQGR